MQVNLCRLKNSNYMFKMIKGKKWDPGKNIENQYELVFLTYQPIAKKTKLLHC